MSIVYYTSETCGMEAWDVEEFFLPASDRSIGIHRVLTLIELRARHCVTLITLFSVRIKSTMNHYFCHYKDE